MESADPELGPLAHQPPTSRLLLYSLHADYGAPWWLKLYPGAGLSACLLHTPASILSFLHAFFQQDTNPLGSQSTSSVTSSLGPPSGRQIQAIFV